MLFLKLIDFNIIGINIVNGVYDVVGFGFNLFIKLSSGQLVDESALSQMLENAYVVLGVVMLFVITFSLLKGMVDVEDSKKSTESARKILINLVTSAIIMVILPTVFSFAFDFQKSVVNSNVIGKFFGYNTSNSITDNNAHYKIVNGLFVAFFDCKNCESKGKRNFGDDEIGNFSAVNETHTFDETKEYVDHTGHFSVYGAFSENDELNFNFLISLIASIIFVYVIISFCIDMAVRLVKLVFYELIAPIPILFRVVPNEKISGAFNAWLKATLACYLEVFVRIFVFYFVVYLLNVIMEQSSLFEDLGALGKGFVILGLVTFMKQAPQLLSEVTGIDSGNMKLGLREKLANGGLFAAGALAGGAITAGTRNAVRAFGNKKNWQNDKGKVTAGSVLRNAGRGLASVSAGALSGAYNSGKNGGFNSKNISDMKKSASSGAKKAGNNQANRQANRLRYQAEGKTPVRGFVGDKIQDAKAWATGGASKYNDIISTSDEMTQAYDKIESESLKVYEKYKNNVALRYTAKNEAEFKKDIKGDTTMQKRMYELYTDAINHNMSMGDMEAQLAKLKVQEIDKDLLRAQATSPSGVFYEEQYKDLLKNEEVKRTQDIAAFESLVSQMKKKTASNIAEAARDSKEMSADDYLEKFGYMAGIKADDVAGIVAAKEDMIARFNYNGSNVVDSHDSSKTYNNLDKNSNIDTFKGISDAYKNIGNDARTASARERLAAEKRKGNE